MNSYSLRVAFLTAGLSELRGGPILMLNYAKAITLFSSRSLYAEVFSLENVERSSMTLHDLTDFLMEYRGIVNMFPIRVRYYDFEKRFDSALKYFLSMNYNIKSMVDFAYFLMTHRFIADPLYLTKYVKHMLVKADIVHIGHWNSDYSLIIRKYAAKNKKSINSKLVCHALIHPLSVKSENRYLNEDLVNNMKIRSIQNILSGYDAITVSTPYELKLLRLLSLKNVYYIGETIDTEFLKKNANIIDELADKVRSQLGSENIILFIGARSRRKGYHQVLKALIKVIEQYPNVIMVCVGNTPMHEKALIEQVEKTLIKNKKLIIYTYLPSLYKYALIKASNLLILPSREETIPLVFLEAWSMRKPVIGAKSPTISSVIKYNGDGGVLINPDNIHETEQAIRLLLSDENKRIEYGNLGYKKFIENFSMEIVGEKLSKVYYDIIAT
jgi:glycosyltransferase involved in cell wall biosynthesis